ncbi:dockerin type I repeat-containing protein [Ruminiclostridium josui]|uniref:dockerin type I repeat-containing protein n=1 Tax=Ruminiclostridium josui TaxID=1499 RepID=UPI000AB66CBA|nr:dockerin type I repeat-containing protein [Ruminiclostridium josui]
MQVGDTVFGDRTYKYTKIPQSLVGAEWIRTACDSKSYLAEEAYFTAKKDISVYIGLDSRITSIPAWLSDWSKTGETLTDDSSVTFNLYKKDFTSGSVVRLGTNGGSSSYVNYTVIVKENTAPAFLYGDVNGDGIVDVLDYSVMRSYLLQITNSMPSEFWQKAGDLNSDGVIDSMDYLYLKMYLLGTINSLPV